MNMDKDSDLYLMLGRLDGKMDALAAMHSTAIARIDGIEKRVGQNEQEVASIKAKGVHGRAWLSTAISIGAVLLSAIGLYLKA